MIIKGGRVLTSAGPRHADVRVESGLVVEVGSDLQGSEFFDAGGAWVGPGFVDLHVHFREPGQEWKEDIATGSAAAAAGGFTAVLAMPNTEPPIDSGHLARFVADRGRLAGKVAVHPVGCLSLQRAGEHLAHLDELWDAGVRIFSDDGSAVADAGLLRNAMEYLAQLGGTVAQHAEDPGLARNGHMHEGEVSSLLGMRGLPALAEEVVVARDLALVRLTGCRYHVQHVSTAGTIAMIRQAKADGLPVTAEVAPHNLAFTDADVARMDPAFKMYPPLRAASDREAVRAGLIDGTIDAVATDHAPHADADCEVPFEEAPRGVIGLETAAAVVNEACSLDQEAFFDRMSIAPARIGGIERHGRKIEPGAPANLTVFDPSMTWQTDAFASKARNSPWLGKEMKGRVLLTLFEGNPTHRVTQ